MATPPGSLARKLVLPLTALVILVGAGAGAIRTRAVERGYHETMLAGADQLSRSLVSATWHAMLADDPFSRVACARRHRPSSRVSNLISRRSCW